MEIKIQDVNYFSIQNQRTYHVSNLVYKLVKIIRKVAKLIDDRSIQLNFVKERYKSYERFDEFFNKKNYFSFLIILIELFLFRRKSRNILVK